MPVVLVLLLAGTWLLSGALVTGTEPLTVAVGRTAVCCLVLTAVAVSSASGRADLRRAAARPGTVWLLGLLGFAGYAAGTLLAIPRIGTSLTNLVVALMPCASVAVGALFFGERSGPRKAVGALLACAAAAGYAALGADAGDLDAMGLLLVAAATVAFAVTDSSTGTGCPGCRRSPCCRCSSPPPPVCCCPCPCPRSSRIRPPRPRRAASCCWAPPSTRPPTSYSTG
ncbi:EamA family transporter [Streptomyces sp. BE230]|uniref:EamA family transporter n=1 Tax=Streptomyces sp. BE230 TaxID=3002526 RepID=UPI002ED43C9F|nr:EamA family transporter [Streptomyces sp. BE230]